MKIYDVQKTLRDTGYTTALALFLQKTGATTTTEEAVSTAKQIITGEQTLPPGAPPIPFSLSNTMLIIIGLSIAGLAYYLITANQKELKKPIKKGK